MGKKTSDPRPQPGRGVKLVEITLVEHNHFYQLISNLRQHSISSPPQGHNNSIISPNKRGTQHDTRYASYHTMIPGMHHIILSATPPKNPNGATPLHSLLRTFKSPSSARKNAPHDKTQKGAPHSRPCIWAAHATTIVCVCVFIPCIIFALLFSLPPSRNSGPGSHSRLFSPPTHYGSCLAFLSREDFSSFLLSTRYRPRIHISSHTAQTTISLMKMKTCKYVG